MELRHLRYLAAVQEHGSLTRAAKALGIGQPSLSDSMRRLETSLGTKLFHREARGVSLTPAGELVLAHASPLLASLDALPKRLANLQDGLHGTYRVGCYHSLGAWFLPKTYARVLEELPDIELQVHSASSGDVTQAVLDRKCELGLVINAHAHPDLVITPVCTDAITMVANGERLRGRDPREVLREGPLLYLDREPFTALLERYHALELLPQRQLRLGDLELVKAMVASGIGVGALPVRVASYGDSGLQVLDPELPRFDDVVHLVMRYDLPRTRALQALRALLVDVGERIRRGE